MQTPESANTSVSSSTTEGSPARHETAFEQCICERKTTEIFCKWCCHVFSGRVRTKCPRHPKRFFLDDFTRCLQCQSDMIDEL
ncbi:hypothetical protein AAVH_03347 [Aphelenchoides avenae]|nr:hypothetical protein AAVH_03347 [Aphelenchus avenae]